MFLVTIFQQEIPFAGERVALQHLGAGRESPLSNSAIASRPVGRELDVREDGHIQPQGIAIQQRNARP